MRQEGNLGSRSVTSYISLSRNESRQVSVWFRMSNPLLYLVAVAAMATQAFQSPVTEDCLQCLCHASSFCNSNFQHQKDVYGLYKMTYPYWLDAGRPTVFNESPTNDGAFKRCSTDPECSGTAVVNYMKRYAKDCNRDGVVDCLDFALIHYLGPSGCRWEGNVDAAYWTRFNSCYHMDRRSEARDMLNEI